MQRHTLKVYMPWYMNLTTACVNCQRSEGCGKQLARFHGRRQFLGSEFMVQVWVLLMNRLLLFIGRELGLYGSMAELINFAAARELVPTSMGCSEEEYFSLENLNRDRVWNR